MPSKVAKTSSEAARRIPVAQISPSPFNEQRRRSYDMARLEELTESVRLNGVLQPILVRPMGKGFEIVFGERRYLATKAAELKDIPAIVQDMDDQRVVALQLIENRQREQSPLSVESGEVMQLAEMGLSNQAAAAALGQTVSWVALRRRIAGLIPELLELVDRGGTPAHWEQVARLTEEQQRNFWQREFAGDADERMTDFASTHVDHLREDLLANYTTVLAEALFDQEDANLVPAAGACSTCTKRSGACGELFPDLADTRKERCLDGDCFRAKIKAHTDARLATIRERHPGITVVHTDFQEALAAKVQHMEPYDLKQWKASKSDKGAKPVYNMATGNVHYLKADKPDEEQHGVDGAGETVEKKPKTLEERRASLELRRWALVAENLLKGGDRLRLANMDRTPAELLMAAVTLGISFGGRDRGSEVMISKDLPTDLAEIAIKTGHGWDKDLRFHTVQEVNIAAIRSYATFFGIDLDPMKAKADKEIPEPKSWAKVA